MQKSCSISREVHNPSAKAAGAESEEAGSGRRGARKTGRRARRTRKHHRSDTACHTQSELSFRLPLATQHTCAARVSAVWMLLDAPVVEPLGGKTYDSTRLTGHGRSSLSLGVNERGLEVRYCQRATADKRAAGWRRRNVFVWCEVLHQAWGLVLTPGIGFTSCYLPWGSFIPLFKGLGSETHQLSTIRGVPKRTLHALLWCKESFLGGDFLFFDLFVCCDAA